jgi:excisionase family DNA binding protein
MAVDQDTDLLTIVEAARQLKVSRVTVHRWLKAGQLQAYHVGPKAVRIRRSDLERLLRPFSREEVSTMKEQPSTPAPTSFTRLDQVPALTEEQKRQALAAVEQARQLGERILARRGGVPLTDSAEIIRAARDERSRQLR